jgi:hypothetical protein
MRRSHKTSALVEAVRAAGIDPCSFASFLHSSIRLQKTRKQIPELKEQIIQAKIVAILLTA